MHSILYDVFLNEESKQKDTYSFILAQVLETYQSIGQSGKNVIAIMGHSAGGNLALGVVIQLLNAHLNSTTLIL